MKKNRDDAESSLRPADQLRDKSSAENILVFLVLAICILAASFFSGHRQFQQKNNPAPLPQETAGKYVWLTGSPVMQDGLYLFTPEQLEDNFPALRTLWAHGAALDATQNVYAIQSDAEMPQPMPLPPEVANIFFQPIPINRADKTILITLPGIGPALAEKIVQRRSQKGPFRSKDELLQISGIGPKKFKALVDHITLD
jgi:predicted flap endonuclease-1-like 5' DNA nuclease